MTNYFYTYSDEAITYSKFRASWRQEYKVLSSAITYQKKHRTQLAKDGKSLRAADAQSQLASMRSEAAAMNETLAETKATWKALLAAGHVARVPSVALQAAE